MNISLNDLNYYLFDGSGVSLEHQEIYNKCYAMWKDVWTQALDDLKNPQVIFSDGFTRQTKIGCIFYKNTCVAMTAFRDVDLRLSTHKDDSLLRSWTPEAFDLLVEDGSRVSICSYLTVAPEFRGKINEELTYKLLAVNMSSLYLLGSDCDVMTGTMRCNRGTDKSAYSSGARFIQKSKMYDVDVDLVGFFKKEILEHHLDSLHPWAKHLWEHRIDLSQVKSSTNNLSPRGHHAENFLSSVA